MEQPSVQPPNSQPSPSRGEGLKPLGYVGTFIGGVGGLIGGLAAYPEFRALLQVHWVEVAAWTTGAVVFLSGLFTPWVRRPVLVLAAAGLLFGACYAELSPHGPLARARAEQIVSHATWAASAAAAALAALVLREFPTKFQWTVLAAVLLGAGVWAGWVFLIPLVGPDAPEPQNTPAPPYDPPQSGPPSGTSTPGPVLPVDRPNCVGMLFAWAGGKKFLVQTTPATQGQLRALLPEHKSYFSKDGAGHALVGNADTSEWPADSVTFEEARKAAQVLSDRPEERAAGLRYRLLKADEFTTASEGLHWTPKSARLSDSHWGDDRTTGSVREFPAHNGLYGLVGNVRVWVTGGRCEEGRAVALGGSYATVSDEVYLSQPQPNVLRPNRPCPVTFHAATGYQEIGFRLVCEVTEPARK